MSTQLFSNLLLINKSAFISEDIGFLTSFFCLQKDLPQEKFIKPWIWLLINIIVLTTLIDLIYFGSGLSILTTILCSPYILFNLYYLFYYRLTEHRVRNNFNALCTCLKENHNLLKKLLTLCQELQIIEKNCFLTDSNFPKIVKSTFEITVKLFDILRDETKQALSLPATIEDVNREDNYISCLPSQLFDDLLQEENPTPYQLKSLIQLVRIQQSELLRRLLCVHISGTLEEKLKTLCRIINSLLRCKDKMSPECFKLKSLYAFHQSSCFKEDQPKISSAQLNGSTFDINYSIRSIRLHVHAAMLLLNNIEKVTSQDSTKNNCIMDDVLKIEKELTLGLDSLKILSKRHRKNDNSQSFNSTKVTKPNFVDEAKTVIIGENFQPTIEDQVFELFIGDDDCLDFQYPDEMEESNAMFDDFTAISFNLFQELKTALIPKAEETREREAKALGIPKEEVPIQLNNDITLKSNEEPKIPLSMRQEVRSPNLLITNNNFTSALATRAAQISKDLKLNRNEECFGDSDYDECSVGIKDNETS